MKYKTLILLASLSLTACKSTYQEQREAALASRPMTVETVQEIIDTTTHVNVQEDAFQGKGQYLDQALYSAAKQIIELQLEPRYLSLEFKLTPEMYYGDWGGFVVALDSPWLLEKGAIKQPLEEIAVLSTNNLYNSHISDDISFSKYNRQILRGIAVAAIDTPLSTKHIAGRGLFGSSLTEKQDLLLSTDFRGFTDNVEKNVSLMSSLITNYNPYGYNAQFSHHSANSKFDPITYAQKGLGETKRAVSFIAVDAQEARNMVGKKYHFVFIPGAAFEVKKTGQKIVIAQTQYTVLMDNNFEPVHHTLVDMTPIYIWYGKDYEEGFTAEHTKPFIKADRGDEPF